MSISKQIINPELINIITQDTIDKMVSRKYDSGREVKIGDEMTFVFLSEVVGHLKLIMINANEIDVLYKIDKNSPKQAKIPIVIKTPLPNEINQK